MKVLTVGGAMVDTIAIIDSDRIERMTMLNAETSFLLMEEGRKTEALKISTHCGGGAINAGVAMARLGADVATLARVGRDDRAELILQRLMSEGVSTRFVIRDPNAPTGASVLVSSHDRNAAIFTFRGANTALCTDELKDDAFAADLVYITSLSNNSADCFPELVKRAKAGNAKVATNPGVRQLSARSGAFFDCLPEIDILSINSAEADVLVPSLIADFGEGGPVLPLEAGDTPPRLVARGLSGGGFDMSLIGFVKAVHKIGVDCIVITDGRDGAVVSQDGNIWHCPVAENIKVAGTAGAGDAFAATFSAFHTRGETPDVALKAATLNAASVVGHVDTQTGLLNEHSLQKDVEKLSTSLRLRHWQI
ncbi:MAG: carbohydrate kinase family protein [Hyphomicrobiaceae bacterium]